MQRSSDEECRGVELETATNKGVPRGAVYFKRIYNYSKCCDLFRNPKIPLLHLATTVKYVSKNLEYCETNE